MHHMVRLFLPCKKLPKLYIFLHLFGAYSYITSNTLILKITPGWKLLASPSR